AKARVYSLYLRGRSTALTRTSLAMVTTIQRWGNSLAVRIPKAFAAQAQLSEDTSIEISIDGDRIILTAARPEWKLETLVAQITPSNRHREIPSGGHRGKEIW
ncbi:MAG: AbrB/MazE/SpoVT family DNA-binding domain-containing protein, partial [Gemmatimonadales bacterium]